MPYLGRPVTNAGQFEIIDDISSDFDGSETSFSLKVGGTDIQPDVANVTITLGGVYQVPSSAYSITGSAINFSEAPESNTTFHGVLAGQSQFIESDFITNTMIKSTAAISGSKIDTDFSAQSFQLTNVTASGDISGSSLISQTHITASGEISASGKIIANGFTINTNAEGIQFMASNGNLFKNIATNSADDFLVQNLKNGENLLILGSSGIGKSTLLHNLAGILTPQSGSIKIFGNDISKSERILNKHK